MNQNQQSEQSIAERTIQWVRECVALSRKKNSALLNHDLATIESCLEQEGQLLDRWAELARLKRFTPEAAGAQDVTPLREALGALLSELRGLNATNGALVASGRELSETLLGVLRPPITYGPAVRGERPSFQPAPSPIISVQC